MIEKIFNYVRPKSMAMFKEQREQWSVDPITALRNENEARLLAEKNTTRRSEIIAEQKRLTTAALRKGVQ